MMKVSEEIQQFKIGRIKYNLPSYLENEHQEQFFLFFKLGEGFQWIAGYEGSTIKGSTDFPMLVEEDTFNRAIKSLKAKIKEL